MPVSPKIIAASKNSPAPPRLATRDFLNTVFYYNWTAVTAILVMLGLGCLIAVLMPASYKAEARLLTLYAGYYNMQVGDAGGRGGLGGIEATQIVSVEAQILSSPELHRAIVQEELGPGVGKETLDRALRRFESHLSIEKVETANVHRTVLQRHRSRACGRDPQQADRGLFPPARRRCSPKGASPSWSSIATGCAVSSTAPMPS